jgi:hypothetical protein
MTGAKRAGGGRALACVLAAAAVGLTACGGGGKSGTSGTSVTAATSNTLRRVEVKVRTGSAQAEPRSMLARAADLLGWPQVAEASHCTVEGGGVTGVPVGGETYVLNNPLLNGDTLDIQVTCGGNGGSVHLTNLQPGMNIEVEVEADDDGFGIKAQAEDVSDVSEVSVSEPSVSEPSEPSVSEPSVSEPSEPSSSS